MYKKLHELSRSIYYWLFIFVFGIVLEATALFYQYFLDYYPCVLCIHVRIIVVGMILVSLVALKFHAYTKLRISLHLSLTILLLLLAERSYNLLGVERGFVTGDCSMNSGLPAWFSIDEWFPWMFKIWEPCGYTPELIFGITMAEALVVFSALLLFLSLVFFVVSLKEKSI